VTYGTCPRRLHGPQKILGILGGRPSTMRDKSRSYSRERAAGGEKFASSIRRTFPRRC